MYFITKQNDSNEKWEDLKKTQSRLQGTKRLIYSTVVHLSRDDDDDY